MPLRILEHQDWTHYVVAEEAAEPVELDVLLVGVEG